LPTPTYETTRYYQDRKVPGLTEDEVYLGNGASN